MSDDQAATRALEGGRPRAAALHLAPGNVVAGRYEVLRFIGQGAMGTVHEVRDRELRDHVALKVLRAEVAGDAEAVQRFKDEILLSRRVTHANVCRIFDLGLHLLPDGRPVTFLTMQLLGGHTLAEHLQRHGPLSTADALPIARDVAEGLAAAHAVGVIHRDLKPANVMVVPPETGVTAVVTDFGLARSAAAPSEATETAPLLGTPAYMAPEQVEGRAVTPAADVYAFGVVLYEMVTGEWPFLGASAADTARKRLTEAPVPPRRHRPDLDPAWERAILACLEVDPARRPESARDVVAGLARRRTGTLRLVAAAALVSVLVTGGLVLLRGERVAAPPVATPAAAPARRAVAVLAFRNLSGDPSRAWIGTALAEMLGTELGAEGALRVLPGENVAGAVRELGLAEAEELAPDALRRLHERLASDVVVAGTFVALDGSGDPRPLRIDARVQHAVTGETVAAFAESGTEAQLFDLVARVGARVRGALGAFGPEGRSRTLRTAMPRDPGAARAYAEGLQKLRSWDPAGARGRLDAAVRAEPGFAPAHAALAEAWAALGHTATAAREASLAVELSGAMSREEKLAIEGRARLLRNEREKALEIYRALHGFYPDELEYGLDLVGALVANGRGTEALAKVGDLRRLPPPAGQDPRLDLLEAEAANAVSDRRLQLAAAERAARRAKAVGAPVVEAAAVLEQARALRFLGDLRRSLELTQEARALYERAGHRAGAGWALNNEGIVLVDLGDFAGARKAYGESRDTFAALGDERGVANAVNNLAEALREHGDIDGARVLFDQALTVFRRIGSRRGTIVGLTNVATVLVQQGEVRRAVPLLEEALALSRETKDRSTVSILEPLGLALLAAGRPADARTRLESALEDARGVGDRIYESSTLVALARTLVELDDLAGARERLRRAIAIQEELGGRRRADDARLALAEVALAQGHHGEAEPLARTLAAAFAADGSRDAEALAHAVHAQALAAAGRTDEARRASATAMRLGEASHAALVRLAVRLAGARVQLRAGDATRARRLAEGVAADAAGHALRGLELDARLVAAQAADARAEVVAVRDAAGAAGLERIRRLAARP